MTARGLVRCHGCPSGRNLLNRDPAEICMYSLPCRHHLPSSFPAGQMAVARQGRTAMNAPKPSAWRLSPFCCLAGAAKPRLHQHERTRRGVAHLDPAHEPAASARTDAAAEFPPADPQPNPPNAPTKHRARSEQTLSAPLERGKSVDCMPADRCARETRGHFRPDSGNKPLTLDHDRI